MLYLIFRIESAGDKEVTYQLPARPLGILRLAGLVPIGFSVVWFGFSRTHH